jgi:hypothetical protein
VRKLSFLKDEGNRFLVFIIVFTVAFLAIVFFTMYEIKEMLGVHLLSDAENHQSSNYGGKEVEDELWECYRNTEKDFMVFYPSGWKLEKSEDHTAILRKINVEKTETRVNESMSLLMTIDYVRKNEGESLKEFVERNKKDADRYDSVFVDRDEVSISGIATGNLIPFEAHCFDAMDFALCLRANYYKIGNTEKCRDTFRKVVSRVEITKDE